MQFFKSTVFKDIELVFIGDIHIGARSHKGRHFRRTIDYVAAKPYRFWYYMGDGAENAMPHAGEMLYDQIMLPTDQYKALVGHFKKIGLKCLGAVVGNHEMRTMRTALLDPVHMMLQAMGILERYHGVGGLHRVQVGSQEYKVGIFHGKAHSKVNPFIEFPDRQAAYPEADVIAMGHTHDLCFREFPCLTIDANGKEEAYAKYWLRTGNYLGYANYAKFAGYRPGLIGSPIVKFSGKAKRIEVDCKTLAAL